jgi:hypothetical protein
MNIDELEQLAKAALAAIDAAPNLLKESDEYAARANTVNKYVAALGPAAMLPLIAELREYRHLCAQVRAVYESDSGFGEGMVISCHRESQRKDTQAVAAMLIWQQPADESADLRIGIRADMT